MGVWLAAFGLSSAALAVIGHRMARSVGRLRAALTRIRANDDEATQLAHASAGGLDGLQRELDDMHRGVERRELRLKTAYEVVQQENAVNRNLAQQLTRSQRIARIGSWEWQRASNSVVCSSEMFRILGVTPGPFNPRPAVIQNLVHKDDRRVLDRWLVQLARGKLVAGYRRAHPWAGRRIAPCARARRSRC